MEKQEIAKEIYKRVTKATPEENWKEWVEIENDSATKIVYEAMDVYAKQEAIAFMQWVAENEYHFDEKMKCWVEYDDDGVDRYVCDNDEQLYDLFKHVQPNG